MQWLAYSGIGGEGTITNALSGGDAKHAMYPRIFIFEAIIRTKVKHFNYCSNVLTVEGSKTSRRLSKMCKRRKFI